ncbi:MAG: A/G-specific adenine glycosylase [Clostridia bacterium]|nr:A/G-specific adenine glycosylase [Clostridia bacterium]
MKELQYPIAPPLLGWFQATRRSLPFRDDPTPYHIWVSEIMLQQTRMAAVLPYYERFMRELPDVRALAECDPERLTKLWEGLGYYSRVRNLQKAAQVVCERYGGELPRTYEELLELPGIGAYTAGAIASISMGIPVPAVDGNVLRVFARLYDDGRDVSLPEVRADITGRVKEQLPPDSAGDFNQALMELGALVCTPRSPDCARCPLRDLCLGMENLGEAVGELPVKMKKKPRTAVEVTVLLVRSPGGWLVMKRPEKGLLAGLWQPLTAEALCTESEMLALAEKLGIRAKITAPLPPARHIFTHVEWTLCGWMAQAEEAVSLPEGYIWMDDMETCSIPSAFRAYTPIMAEDLQMEGGTI